MTGRIDGPPQGESGWDGAASAPGTPQGQPYAAGPAYGAGQPSPQGTAYAAGQPGPAPRRTNRSRLPLAVAGGTAAVLALGGGAYAFTRLNGAGAQPDEVLPGNAIAYVRVDLDPSASQKVAAFRLVDKLPAMKDAVKGGDVKKAIVEQIEKSSGVTDIDYDKDIAPWLGDRFAVAVLPGGSDGKLVPVTAVAVKDEQKAREGMDKITAKAREKAKKVGGTSSSSSPVDPNAETVNVFRDGYVLTMPKANQDAVTSAINAGTLAKKDAFVNDMKALGDPGIASSWVDSAALSKALSTSSSNTDAMTAEMNKLAERQKPVASALRLSSDYVELASNGADPGILPGGQSVSNVTNLPDSTAAFVSIAGAGDAIKAVWPIAMDAMKSSSPHLEQELADFETQTGLSLPGDLATVVGRQADVIVPQSVSSKDASGIGVRFDTDVTAAQAVLTKLETALRMTSPIPRKVDGSHLYLGVDQKSVAALTASGDLTKGSAYGVAVPDGEHAQSVAYVDLDKLEGQYLSSVSSDYREAVKSLRAFGMSSAIKDGRATGTVRLVLN